MITTRTLATTLTANVSGYTTNMAKATNSTREFNRAAVNGNRETAQAIDQTNRNMTRMGSIVGGILASGIILQLGQSAIQAFGQIRDDASNLNESINAVNVVFGESAGQILAFGENADQSMGLSQRAFNEAAVQFSNFADVIATDGQSSADVVEEMTRRASDFASVHNLDVQEALRLFQSGLAGETEPLRRYGILLSEAEVKAFAYSEGIASAGAELSEQEKVLARYGLIMRETSNTQGDFANTADEYANAQRRVTAEAENARAELGQALLPVLAAISDVTSDILQGFQRLPGPVQLLVVAIVGLTAAAGTAATAMRFLGISGQLALRALGPLGLALAVGGVILSGLVALGSTSEEASGNVEGLAQTLERGTGAITSAARESVLLELQQKGLIDSGRELGITAKDLVNAYLGEEDALQRVNDALNTAITEGTTQETVWKSRKEGISEVVTVMNDEAIAAQALKDAIAAGNITTEEAIILAQELGIVTGETGEQIDAAAEEIKAAMHEVAEAAGEIAEAWSKAILDIADANDALSDANAALKEDEELTTAAFIEQFEKRVKAAEEHNANIIAIQERTSAGVFDLMEEDLQNNPELAALIAQATGEEFDQIVGLYEGSAKEANVAANREFVNNIPALERIAGDSGTAFAQKIADKIRAGKPLTILEVRKIMNSAKTEVEAQELIALIEPNLDDRARRLAQAGLDNLAAGRTVWITPRIAGGVSSLRGGITISSAQGGIVDGFASGGSIDGRAGGRVNVGTGPRSDDVLALLSRGEFVVNAASTDRNRYLLEAINRGRLRGYQGGGEITQEQMQQIARGGFGPGRTINGTDAVAATNGNMPDEFMARATIDLGEGIERRMDIRFTRERREMKRVFDIGVGGSL